MLFFNVTADSRSFVFFDALVQVPTRIADIICIAQITFKIIHSALLVYDGRLLSLHFNCVFDLSAGVNRTDLGVYLSAEIT